MKRLFRNPASLMRTMLFFWAAGFLTCLPAQTSPSLQLVGRIWFPSDLNGCFGADTSGGSDVWGYTAPDGQEYAIMGVRDGVAFVAVPQMLVIQIVPGPTLYDCFYHRDIKTYQHYAYVVSENRGTNEGMMIIDLSPLPDSVRFVGSYIHGQDIRSHNLSIDTTTGFAYVVKQNYSGFRVIDLADPENPVEVTMVATPDIHDVYADHDTVFVAEGYAGSFSIFDLSDKQNPVLLARVQIPGAGYVHNIWANESRTLCMTTEETTGKTVKLWNISDLSNITLLGEYLGANQLAHNTHLQGNYAFISHYSYGVVVVDISEPTQPVEVARFDTYPKNDDPGFWGCWGAYPFTAGNYVYASDIEGYLTVLELAGVTTSIAPWTDRLPTAHRLLANYPNPFNPETVIPFQVATTGRFRLEVWDAQGRRIRTLLSDVLEPGTYRIRWDGRDERGNPASSGVYFARLIEEGSARWQQVQKMLLLK